MDSDPPHAVYDASVLFPFHTAHILVFAAIVGSVRARWTREIQVEWVERSLEHYPDLKRDSVEKRRDAMDRALPGALVDGYGHRIAGISFPDPDDRHVVAAALECGATLIVTRDKTHFNEPSLRDYGLRPIDPDVLLCERLERTPDLMEEAIGRARGALSNSKPDVDTYAGFLVKTGLDGFAGAIRQRLLSSDNLPKPP